MLTRDPKEFKLIRPLTWEDVFAIWRENEGRNPDWAEHAKSEGYGSWEEWRTEKVVRPLKCAERKWYLYKITNPFQTVPTFHGGPFKSWEEKYYGEKKSPVFSEIAQSREIQNHEKIRGLLESFPTSTILTGLVSDKGIIIIEGMHRCCAIALAAQRGQILETTVFIVLARLARGEFSHHSSYSR